MPVQSEKSIFYIADPMCSWCWGFSPVMEAFYEKYQNHVNIQLLMGGLRPANTERFDTHRREYILGHWRAVHERTGQPFNFKFQMGPDFIYDTEPASRATVAVRTLAPEHVFVFFKDLQQAFYVTNMDVTKKSVLTDLAQAQGIDRQQFLTIFDSSTLREKVWEEFEKSRTLGVTGFPSVLAQDGSRITPLAHGYQSFDVLAPAFETWLKKTSIETP